MSDCVRGLLDRISDEQLRRDLHYLTQDPLPYRKLNYTVPGHTKTSLHEADDFIQAELEAAGYAVEREAVQVQAFRCDVTKPKAHQYAAPDPSDPWHTAYNLYANRAGEVHPEEIVVLASHKDSPSWVDSPGAYDNAVGVIANLAIARALQGVALSRSVRFLFCNEEHTPWTSVTAAQGAAERGERIVAVINVDGIGGKSQADIDAGRQTSVAAYTMPEGKPLADLFPQVNEEYALGLVQSVRERPSLGDDDGSFITAGFPAAVLVIGSLPYEDPCYHAEGDTADRVDIANVRRATQAILAVVLRVAELS